MTTLIYAGVSEGNNFFPLTKQFDKCYGFEADPWVCHVLTTAVRHIDNPNIQIIEGALGEKNENVSFWLHDKTGTNSMGKINHVNHPEITATKEIIVKGINLYDWLQENGIDFIDLYISDIQGMDLTVLKTLKPMINERRIKEIQCEVEKEDVPEVYHGLFNKRSGFDELLKPNYKIKWHRKELGHYTEDIRWILA